MPRHFDYGTNIKQMSRNSGDTGSHSPRCTMMRMMDSQSRTGMLRAGGGGGGGGSNHGGDGGSGGVIGASAGEIQLSTQEDNDEGNSDRPLVVGTDSGPDHTNRKRRIRRQNRRKDHPPQQHLQIPKRGGDREYQQQQRRVLHPSSRNNRNNSNSNTLLYNHHHPVSLDSAPSSVGSASSSSVQESYQKNLSILIHTKLSDDEVVNNISEITIPQQQEQNGQHETRSLNSQQGRQRRRRRHREYRAGRYSARASDDDDDDDKDDDDFLSGREASSFDVATGSGRNPFLYVGGHLRKAFSISATASGHPTNDDYTPAGSLDEEFANAIDDDDDDEELSLDDDDHEHHNSDPRMAVEDEPFSLFRGHDGNLVESNRHPHRAWSTDDTVRIRWRTIGLLVLVLLFFASVTVTNRTRQHRHHSNVYTGDIQSGGVSNSGDGISPYNDDDDDGNGDACTDPDSVMALKARSAVQGLENGAVASDQGICSTIGTSLLRDAGGNAVDAAVAIALCLGVVNPASSGLGGGAFIVIHADPPTTTTAGGSTSGSPPRTKKPLFHDARSTIQPWPMSVSGKITEVVDCREVAPGAATTDMYVNSTNPYASTIGGLAVPVLGELRGLEVAHARHGILPWATVVQPAIDLVSRGVVVSAYLAHEIQDTANAALKKHGYPDHGLRKLITRNDDWRYPLREGDLLINQALADTLQSIQEQGADAIYTGTVAETMAEEIQNAGGIVTAQDIESYRPTLRTPVVAHDVNGFSICGVPPPSSGGAAVIGAIRFLSGYGIPLATFADTLSVHRMVEGFKNVFAIRMSLSDPAYNTETVEDAVRDLIQGNYMGQLRRVTKDNETLPLSAYGGSKWAQLNDTAGTKEATDAKEGDRVRHQRQNYRRRDRQLYNPFGYLDDHGTSHFSVIDKDGNVVAMTTSINTVFASQVVSPSTGILFSNTMDDFGNPGSTSYYGLTPSEANFIKPGKIPLSSMSPTLVFQTARKDTGDDDDDILNVSSSSSSSSTPPLLGDLLLAVGASGGAKIITAVSQVIINVLWYGIPLFEAIAHPRVHDQLLYHDSKVTLTDQSPLLQGPVISVSQRTRDALLRRGHNLLDIDYTGTTQGIYVDLETQRFTAVSDIRKDGAPDGY